jgi:hypothetical protein
MLMPGTQIANYIAGFVVRRSLDSRFEIPSANWQAGSSKSATTTYK